MLNPISRHAYPAREAAAVDQRPAANAPNDDLDLHGLVAVFRAHWLSVLTVMALTLLLGLVLALSKQPQFKSTGVISASEAPGPSSKGKAPRADPRAGGRDVALLRSRRLAAHVIQALSSAPLDGASAHAKDSVTPGEIVYFLNRLEVSQSPGSPVIEISYRGDSPVDAARVVNQVIDSFRKLKAEQIGKLFAAEKEYVETELKRQQGELRHVEQRMEDFRQANGLVEGAGLTVKVGQVGALNSQLVLAEVEAEKAASRWRQIDALVRAGNMAAVGAAVESPLVRRFREKEVELRNRISEMRNEYGPRHPALVDVQSQLQDLRASIDRELRNLARAMKAEATLAQQKVTSLRQNVERLEDEIAQAQSAGRGLLDLELKAESLRESVRSLLQRAMSLGDKARDLAVAKLVSVISPAYEPVGPVFPTRKNILSLAVAAALLLGLLTALLAEYFNPKVTARWSGASAAAALPKRPISRAALGAALQDEVALIPPGEKTSEDLPVVVPIPGDGTGIVPAAEILMKQQSKFAAAISALNEKLHSRLGNGAAKAVLLTGHQSIGDKVSVAAALAALNTQKGLRVVLVDLTHGEAELHRAFGMQPVPGIAEVLTRSTTLTKAFQTDYRTHVTLLPRGDFADNRLVMKLLEVAPSLVTQLKKHFDLVLLVARNVDVAIEAEMIPNQVELAVVVASGEAGATKQQAGKVAAHPKLQRLHSRLLTVAVQR